MTDNDTVRSTYRALTPVEIAIVAAVKRRGQEFIDEIPKTYAPKREFNIAITKIEEAVMWAVKGLTG